MPQVDLETLVSACAGGSYDNKIACETLAGPENPSVDDSESDSDPDLPDRIIHPDFPPESFWLSKDAEFDWFDRNAFFERKDSTRGNSNSGSLNPSFIQTANSNSNSQRFSVRSKRSVIGLPKPQKSCFVDSKNRRTCKTANARLFPKRSGSVGGRLDPPVIEPSSPKVSCMGRVRSKRDRNRRLRTRQRSKSNEPAPVKPPKVKPPKPAGRKRAGLLSSFRAIFRSHRRSEPELGHNAPSRRGDSHSKRSSGPISRDIRERLPAGDLEALSTESSLPRRSMTESDPGAVGLGGMKRFASGRRPDSWASDVA